MTKYSDDGPFHDPVLRCKECHKLVLLDDLHKRGMCPLCGCRKVNKVSIFSAEELAWMREKKVDPDFLALFGNDDGVTADKHE